MIDPRRLQVLLAVATHGSVRAAAAALHLTAPAVSQQLVTLERETGVGLIDRSGRRVRLTAAGRLLARHGERIATELREAERDLAQLTGRASGPVRLAAFQSVMSDLIAPTLRRMADEHPSIQPSVSERYSPAAVAALRQGDLEIVLTEYDAELEPHGGPGVGLRALIFDPYVLVSPRDWAVTINRPADLVDRPWVAGPPDTACDHALRRLVATAGITQHPRDVCVEFPSVLALVAAGRGVSIVPQMALTEAAVDTQPNARLGRTAHRRPVSEHRRTAHARNGNRPRRAHPNRHNVHTRTHMTSQTRRAAEVAVSWLVVMDRYGRSGCVQFSRSRCFPPCLRDSSDDVSGCP